MLNQTQQPSDPLPSPRQLSVAPMMDWTDRHCRYFHRLLAPNAFLYTEMVTTGALLFGDTARFLDYNPQEHPVALQLGGSDPEALSRACLAAKPWHYDELNLNVGCPSDRVQKGRFGACLMKEPGLVKECLSAMVSASDVPVTIKCRVGVDEMDSDQALIDFVGHIADSGIDALIIHARKAWLSGLSPKQNREVPDLNYARVREVVKAFPQLQIILNGGLNSVSECLSQWEVFEGLMIGRAAYQTPWLLTELSAELGHPIPPSRRWVVDEMVKYTEQHVANGGRVHEVARHMLGLFHGQPGARAWRQKLSQTMHRPEAKPQLLLDACPEPACFNPVLEDFHWPVDGSVVDG